MVDERLNALDADLQKVSLTQDSVAALGLHAPDDFGWSCGDYGLYLARATWPEQPFFWLIEYDVRITGDAARFFDAASESDADYLGLDIRPALPDWTWYQTARSSDAKPYRCFFPLGRFSARAIDTLLAKRREQSAVDTRRRLWPNDEAFVATTLVHSGLKLADVNDLGGPFYSAASMSYDNLQDEESLPDDRAAPPTLYHPVLPPKELALKRQRAATEVRGPGLKHRARRAVYGSVNNWKRW